MAGSYLDIDVINAAKQVIRIERDEIASLENRINDNFANAVDIIYNCSNRVIVTGMGKSGLIGRKISATLASTGTPSLWMHPAEALHGDLGMVQNGDVVIALSNSGETEELARLLPLIKKIGAKLISMVGNINSTLARYSDVVLDLSINQEACPLGLAPTSSTTATLVIGDALAICVYQKKGFRVEDFAFYHPGGNLGKKLILKVSDIMRTGKYNPIVSEDSLIKEVLIIITTARAGAASVVGSDGKIKGFFTDGDLRRAIEKDEAMVHKPVSMFMTKNPVSIKPDCLAAEALRILKERKIDELPVVDDNGLPVGVIAEGDLLGL